MFYFFVSFINCVHINMVKWFEKSITVAEDQSLRDEGSLKEPEEAMLCERPTVVLPLTHEEQIH